jgi:RimJ/RimL family protein N-acetyltransferase
MIIKNNNLLFRPLEEKDLSYMVKWRNDPIINKFTASFKPITLDEEINWFKNMQNNPSAEIYLGYDTSKDKPIGYANLKKIDNKKNELEVGCYICEHEYLNKGVSFIVAASFLDYLFFKRNFNRAYMYIHEKHEIGIRAGVFMGAVFEGYLDKSIFRDAKTVIYSFYKDNYIKRKEDFINNPNFYNKLYRSLTYIEQ